MATAKLYSVNPSVKMTRELRGQALQVWTELNADVTPRLATDIDAKVGPLFKTRQDTLRVTLYYILVFKKSGHVVASTQSAPVDTLGNIFPDLPAPTDEQLEDTIVAS